MNISYLPHTSIDKEAHEPPSMPDSKVDPLPFHPSKVLSWESGYVAIGIDGEFLALDVDMKKCGEVKKPFPCSAQQVTKVDNQLIATWVDHELLLARMASFDLSKPFANGPDRGDLRVRTSIDAALHPAQTIWSHVLDAEPLALCSTDEQFVFILWKKGIYAMGKGTGEDWRKPEPSWPELEKLPHADAVVSASIQGPLLHVWSKGGGHKIYQSKTGEILVSEVIPYDGILNSVYSHEDNHLLCYESGDVLWYNTEGIQQTVILSGPVQHALWNIEQASWHIAGWREEACISLHEQNSTPFREIPVQIVLHNGSTFLLLNDGTFVDSAYPFNSKAEE